MRTWLIATVFLAAPMLLTAEVPAAQAAERQDKQASEFFDQVVPKGLLRDLYNQALSTVQEYVELEGSLPGEGQSRHQAGEFRLKLFPQGKSRSREHVTAEGSFRLSPDADQREFTLRFKSTRDSPPGPSPSDDVI